METSDATNDAFLQCLGGDLAMGGGGQNSVGAELEMSRPLNNQNGGPNGVDQDATGWEVVFDGSAGETSVYVICLDV